MQPDIGIVRMYRRSDGLSTIIDEPNTLTHKLVGRNDAHKGPASRPRYIEYCPTQSDICLRILLRLQSWNLCRCHNFHEHVAVLRALLFTHIIHHRETLHRNRQFCTTQRFRLDSTEGFQLD